MTTGQGGVLPVMDIDLLVEAALRRALVEPAGRLLYTSKEGEPGLFPATAPGRRAAAKAIQERYIDPAPEVGAECGRITAKGREKIAGSLCPKTILEDFVRVLEHRQGIARQMLAGAQKQIDQLERMQAGLGELRSALLGEEPPRGSQTAESAHPCDSNSHQPGAIGLLAGSLGIVREFLAGHERSSGADLLLFQLYDHLTGRLGPITLGEFHDQLRVWHGEGFVALHPWTGPLYQMPRPEVALLTGHEIACYVRWSGNPEVFPSESLTAQQTTSRTAQAGQPTLRTTQAGQSRSLVV